MSIKTVLVVPIAVILSLFPASIKQNDINQIRKLTYISGKIIEERVEKIDREYQECVDLLSIRD